MTTTNDVVGILNHALLQRIGESRYNLWFAGKTRLALHDDHLSVGVANLFLQDWLKKQFTADIEAVAEEAFGARKPVRFVIDGALLQASRLEQADAPSKIGAAPMTTPAPKQRQARQRRFRELGDFIVGSCNRVAHASALSVIETPHDAPIPLVLHGPVGVGKSHLLEGVNAGLSRRYPDWRVVFLTAEDFTNRFVAAMHAHKLGAFRKQFRDCDALLVDDVGFLAKKQATQEEFLHTLDAHLARERPVILTSDCHPRLADHFSAELTDRLAGGSVWTVAPPDRPTRQEILRAKSIRSGGLPSDVLEFLAENLRGNVRELEGAVHSVVHLARVTGRALDVDLAREALGDLIRFSLRHATLDDVERAICDVLGLSRETLFSKKRQWIYSYPRMLAMHLSRKQVFDLS